MNRRLTRKYFYSFLAVSVIALLVLSCSPGSQITPIVGASGSTAPTATKADWETKWEQVLEEARKERQVVIYGGFTAPTRIALMEAFSQRYGLDLDITIGRGSEIGQKLMREHRAGLKVADAVVNGRTTMEMELKPAGIFGSLEPLFLLPEVKDPRGWFGGQLPLTDDKLILTPTENVDPPIAINTSMVKREEITSMRDFLNPRWKGKIAMDNPTIGSGLNWFAAFTEILDYDFMRALAKMEPATTSDKRLMAEWIARGKYPVAIAPGSVETITELIDLGAPVSVFVPKEGANISSGSGTTSYVANAPHPNATKLFINWLLSKEGQTVFSRASGLPSARLDVPNDHIPPFRVRQPGVNYVRTAGEEYLRTLPEKQRMAREIFGGLFR
ncbi:MAG: extracellular solute-binding protein [Chloroflexi bacterium]|nr:extracellular solute-binding protein [Chloroflexota bacterium]